MKELYIDKHSEFCLDVEHKYCDTNPERFLFFLGNQFFLVTYHNCMAYDVHDFEMSLIKKVCVKYKILSRWDINRGININRDLNDFRIRNKELKKYIYQVNYIYQNAAGIEYGITTLTEYIETICNQDIIYQNYISAKELIKNNQYDWLLPKLERLFHANTFYVSNNTVFFKTTEHIIKYINNFK